MIGEIQSNFIPQASMWVFIALSYNRIPNDWKSK